MFGRIAREHAMHITIAGSGNVGVLAGGWLKTGHRVTFATRDVAGDKARELREQGFGVVSLNDAAASTDVIMLAVLWAAVEVTIRSLGDFAGKVLIDTTDPLKSGRELAIGFGDSGGETVARLVPSARCQSIQH
jgi:predicted dinucleotide-binding enzyme